MDNKRGQGLSINAIILIVLGVIVLVVLIAGFAFGWSNLKDQLFSSNNVDKISQACDTACNLNSQYDYCTLTRDLKANDLPNKKVTDTCDNFVKNYGDKYGFKSCQTFSCPSQQALKTCGESHAAGSTSEWAVATTDKKCPDKTGGIKGVILPGSFSDNDAAKICCSYTNPAP